MWNYTVTPTAPDFGKPTLKVVDATDTYLEVVVTSPKSLKGVKNIVYDILADAVGTPVSPMKKSEESDELVPEGVPVKIMLTDAEPGEGHAQNYYITLCSAQILDPKLGEGNYTLGTELEFKDIYTKEPAYDNALSLSRKSVTVTEGYEKEFLANVVYSKDSTYRELTFAELTDSRGVTKSHLYPPEYGNPEDGLIYDKDEQALYLTDKADLEPGKYTLVVHPMYPYKEYVYPNPAKLTLTVNPAVTGFDVTAPTSSIYKAPNKSASIKLTAKATYDDPTFKPDNTKVEWDIEAEDPALKKALSIKNGTVTVDKKYEVQDDEAENTFYVVVKATDLGAKSASTKIGPFVVKAGYAAPVKMAVGKISGEEITCELLGAAKNPEGHISTDFTGKKLILLDANGDRIAPTDMDISVSPKTGFFVDPKTNYIAVTKLGTYTVTAKMKDGGKKSLSMKFAVKGAMIDSSKPYADSVSLMETTNEIVFDKNNCAEAVAESYIMVSSKMCTSDGEGKAICDRKTTISFKNAKKVNNYDTLLAKVGNEFTPNVDTFVLWPTGTDVSITITHKFDGKTEKKTYKIKFPTKGKGTVTNAKKEVNFYRDKHYGAAEISWNVKDVKYDSSKQYCIMLEGCIDVYKESDTAESIKKKGACIRELIKLAQSKPASVTLKKGSSDTIGSVTLSCDAKDLKAIKDDLYPGKYPMYMYLYEVTPAAKEGDEPVAKLVTKTAKVTINVTDLPKPSGTVSSTITLKKNASKAYVDVKYKDCYKVNLFTFNALVDGQNNNVKDLFCIEYCTAYGEDYGKYVLRKINPDEKLKAGTYWIWIQVQIEGLDGSITYEYKKVKIKVK